MPKAGALFSCLDIMIIDFFFLCNFRYYNSKFDIPSEINATLPYNYSYEHVMPVAKQIHALATAMSKTLYKMATSENQTLREEVDMTLVS